MSSTPAYREHYRIADSALHGVHKPIGANIFRWGSEGLSVPTLITRPLRWFK